MIVRQIYHAIITEIPEIPKISNMGRHETRNTYLILFSCHPQCLNFKANIGISATRSQLLINTRTMSSRITCDCATSISSLPTMSAAQKRAFAGVGNPMNDVVCRSSRLNFASRIAENAAITNATYGTAEANV